MTDFRCRKCNKLLARYVQCQGLNIKCTRCGTDNHSLDSDNSVRFAFVSYYPYLIPLSKTIAFQEEYHLG